MALPEIQADLIIDGAAEVVTCAIALDDRAVDAGHGPRDPASMSRDEGFLPLPAARWVRGAQGQVGAIAGGAVACAGDRIVFVGTSEECRRRVELGPGGRRIDARGGTVTPGLIDAHTHLPFAGWREAEFEKRLLGATYLDIAAAGGGIMSTVRSTRAAEPEALEALVRERLDAMILAGTTTVEAKSGYGLSLESEVKILRVLARAADHPVEILPTFLGAHVIPPEFRDGRRSEYLRLLVEEMIPVVAKEGLARFCDVFVDEGAFTLEEARRILETARESGLDLRVHAEQLVRTGAAALAASLAASSVDHLEGATEEDIAALAATWSHRGGGIQRGTVAVLLPGACFFLRETVRPPARALIEAGVPVALATDFNPGSSPCLALPPVLNLACVLFGMTPDETIVAATRNAALSLGIEDRVGSLAAGKQADLAVWDLAARGHLAYRFGPIPCRFVVKKGRIVVEDGHLVPGAFRARPGGSGKLVELTIGKFLDRLSSESPTPGGGSASALAGAQGAALLQMVIAVTLKGDKYAGSRGALQPIHERATGLRSDLAALVDRDAEAYDAVVAANRMPRQTPEEKASRKAAREKALLFAAEVPLKTAELAAALAALASDASAHINPNAASDLLVAVLLAETALEGAAANVRINLASLKSEAFAAKANEQLEAFGKEASMHIAGIRVKFASTL